MKRAVKKNELFDSVSYIVENEVNVPSIFQKQSRVMNMNIFDQVCRSKSLESEVTKWISGYKIDKIAAMVDLVNFVLMAAGARKNWIARDVDLEALSPQELDDLLLDMMTSMSENETLKSYPLTERTKGPNNFRNKFQQFFELLTEKIRSMPSDAKRKYLNSADLLHTITEQLISLSSIAVVNVRDAVTEAVLSMGKKLSQNCGELKEQIAVTQRQIATEVGTKRGASGLTNNPKYVSCLKLRDTALLEMEALSQHCNNIFNSVLVHRLKDFNEEVRCVSIKHLYDFLLFDVNSALRVDYLKYVGFSCSDFAASVRYEAVRLVWMLLQDDSVAGYLQQFVEHFMDRFIEIASADIDPGVALQMVQAFRAMQKNGLLDTVEEEKLDLIDRIVFDSSASERVREEALGFLMDHTEGFDDVATNAENEEDNVIRNASKSRRRTFDGSHKALAKRQQTALQLETLTEFALHHLRGDLSEAVLLAEACLLLPNYDVLYDWSTIIALLLRESDDLISSSLQPGQTTILLHLMLTSARQIFSKHKSGKADGGAVVSNHYETLNMNLQQSLGALLLRFKDDEEQLAIIMGFLHCLDFSLGVTIADSKHAGSGNNVKSLKAVLKILVDVFHSTSNGLILRKIASALHSWHSLEDPVMKGLVATAEANLSRACFRTIMSASEQLHHKTVTTVEGVSGAQSKLSSRNRISNHHSTDLSDSVMQLSANMGKFKLLCKWFDCETLMGDEGIDLVKALVDSAVYLVCVCTIGPVDDANLSCVVSGASNSAHCLYLLLLWKYRGIVEFGTGQTNLVSGENRKRTRNGKKRFDNRTDRYEISENLMEDSDELVEKVNMFSLFRDSLLQLMSSWLSAYMCLTNVESTSFVNRKLGLVAFEIISDLRTFFGVRNEAYCLADQASVFRPTADMLFQLKTVFEKEGSLLANQLTLLDDANVDQTKRMSLHLLDELLFPFSRTLLFDFDHLNRRQAGSIVAHILDGNELVLDGVRLVLMQFKDRDAVKYLEVQLVALKMVFEEHVMRTMQSRFVDVGDDEGFDIVNQRQLEEQAFARTESLARRLSSTMGVGRLKDVSVLEALVKMLKYGIDYSLQSSRMLQTETMNIGFTSFLAYYVRFLPPQYLREVSQYLATKLLEHPDILAEMNEEETPYEFDEFVLRDVEKLKNFSVLLQSGSKSKTLPSKLALPSFVAKSYREHHVENHDLSAAAVAAVPSPRNFAFALGLDIEDVDDSHDDDMDQYQHARSKKIGKLGNENLKSQRSSRSNDDGVGLSSLAVVMELGEEEDDIVMSDDNEDDLLDALPSSRRFR